MLFSIGLPTVTCLATMVLDRSAGTDQRVMTVCKLDYLYIGCMAQMSWKEKDGVIINLRDISPSSDKHLFLAPGYKDNPEDENEHEVYRYPHGRFRAHLLAAKYLIVIGFSFRDPAINRILDHALSNNQNLRVLSINPENSPEDQSGWFVLNQQFPNRMDWARMKFGDNETIEHIKQWVAYDPSGQSSAAISGSGA